MKAPLSLLLGLIAMLAALAVRTFVDQPWSGDLSWPLCAARQVMSSLDAYACFGPEIWTRYPSNPLTAALVAMPFVPLGLLAAPALFGASTGLLAYAVLTRGERWQLLILISAPFWHALYFLQWSPLVTALWLLPSLLPLVLVKPHIGFPVLLLHLSRRRLLACALFLALTFLLVPDWPWRWWPQAQSYDGFIPLLWLPLGPILLAALLRWREKEARLLLLMACMPQRAIYDVLLLGMAPRSKGQMLFWLVSGWLGLAGFYLIGGGLGRPLWLLSGFYLPSLLCLLPYGRKRSQRRIMEPELYDEGLKV